MQSARVSIGNTSETVRYAALAPAEAKKKTTQTQAVNEMSASWCSLNSSPVMISNTPESRYVPAIIGLRPTMSNSGLSSSAPAKLPAANTAMKYGTLPEGVWKYSVSRLAKPNRIEL